MRALQIFTCELKSAQIFKANKRRKRKQPLHSTKVTATSRKPQVLYKCCNNPWRMEPKRDLKSPNILKKNQRKSQSPCRTKPTRKNKQKNNTATVSQKWRGDNAKWGDHPSTSAQPIQARYKEYHEVIQILTAEGLSVMYKIQETI